MRAGGRSDGVGMGSVLAAVMAVMAGRECMRYILIKTCQLERVVEVSTWSLPPGDHEEPRDPRFKKIAYLPASVRTPSPA